MKRGFHKNSNWLVVAGTSLFIIAVTLIIWFLLQGETKTTGEWSKYTSNSLTCEINNKPYYLHESQKALNSTTQINMIFGNDKLSSISLLHKTLFPDAKTAKNQSDAMEFAINHDFGKNGLNPYSLSANFSNKEESTQFSLYATSSDINQITIKYFLLEKPLNDIDEYQKTFQSQGFNCKVMRQSTID